MMELVLQYLIFSDEIKIHEQWKNRDHKMIKSINLKSITLDTLVKK